MPITRVFLDVCRPALVEAATYLQSRFASGRTFDLSGVMVVVPGGRAGRRLLELLVDAAAREGQAFAPPTVVTIGGLPEQLYQPKRPFATTLTQQLAWARTLRQTARDRLRPLMPRPPEAPDDPAWLDWGDLLRKEHAELAADALDFSHVADKVARTAGAAEGARWQVLCDIQKRYLSLLDELELWDLQTARLEAVKRHEFATDRPLVLVGTVDLNGTQRDMLDQVADHVTVLVPAAPEWASRFDGHGCLKADAWNDPGELAIDIDDGHFTQVEGPAEQAQEVVRRIAAWGGRFRADEITVGFPDEDLAPHVERQLRQCGLPARWGPGRPLAKTAPYRLLQAIADWLERGAYPEWAGLLRHPEISAWLGAQGLHADWLMAFDAYYNEHLPQRWDGPELLGDSPTKDKLRRVRDAVQRWLEPLCGPARSLEAWSGPLFSALAALYARELQLGDEDDAVVWQACQQIRRTLDDFEKVPPPLRPTLTASNAIRLVVDQAVAATVPARADAAAIELLGWLELALDDAPALLVTSFNDGLVPQSVNADPFLPNTLRGELGLDDNARRYARDAYALSVMRASRPDLHLIVARRNADGDPVSPSRLLFATDYETVARRAVRLFDPPRATDEHPPLPGEHVPRRARSAFAAPSPTEILARVKTAVLDEPLRLSVSDFKSYLTCPFRFLLRKVARCEAVTDEARELDGGGFGSLAHDVLSNFGRSERRDSTDPEAIRVYLRAELERRVHGQYGHQPRPALLVQAEQLRLRLDAFAELQARRAAEGWRIEFVEDTRRQQEISLTVDSRPFVLVGRIDRIDVHRATGRHAVFDYKTGDRGDGPVKTHTDRDARWLDLQLPLYRHLARSLGIAETVDLGYIVLPKDLAKVGVAMANWTADQLTDADESAWEVVRRIRRREFDPSPEFASGPYDDFARICLATVMS